MPFRGKKGGVGVYEHEGIFFCDRTNAYFVKPTVDRTDRKITIGCKAGTVDCAVNGVKFCGRDARLLTHQNRQLSAPARLLMAHILKKTYKGNVGLL